MGTSDNNRLQIDADTETSSNPKIALIVPGTVSMSLTQFCLEVETNVNVTGVTQKVEIYNIYSAEFEEVDSRAATTSDRLLHISMKGDPEQYIDDSNHIVIRISFYDTGVTALSWNASVDVARCKLLY